MAPLLERLLRVLVLFPGPTWQGTTVCNSSSRASSSPVGIRMYTVHRMHARQSTHMYTLNKNEQNLFLKVTPKHTHGVER